MILSLVVALLVTCGGALATYLYDEGASVLARLCAGVCIGLSAFGLIGFALASFLGLTAATILISTVVIISPLTLLLHADRRRRIQSDLLAALANLRIAVARPSWSQIGYFVYYGVAAIIIWQIFGRAMIETPQG